MRRCTGEEWLSLLTLHSKSAAVRSLAGSHAASTRCWKSVKGLRMCLNLNLKKLCEKCVVTRGCRQATKVKAMLMKEAGNMLSKLLF